MSNLLNRIEEFAQKSDINIGALERKIGASKGVISRALNNGTDIQSKWLVALVENYPHISTEWLLTGNGSMFAADHAETKSCGDPIIDRLLAVIEKKDTVIQQQAEQIGQLRERLERQGKTAYSATSDVSARVG